MKRSCVGERATLNVPLGDSTVRLAKLLVAVDFSLESKKAVQYALAFARQFGALVTLIHVVEPISCQADYGYGSVTRKIPNEEKITRTGRRLNALGRKLTGSGLKPATVVRNGCAHDQITQAAKELDVDLIIMGTRGLCASEQAQLGSTAERVVRDAPCPVLVVRKKEHEFVANEKLR